MKKITILILIILFSILILLLPTENRIVEPKKVILSFKVYGDTSILDKIKFNNSIKVFKKYSKKLNLNLEFENNVTFFHTVSVSELSKNLEGPNVDYDKISDFEIDSFKNTVQILWIKNIDKYDMSHTNTNYVSIIKDNKKLFKLKFIKLHDEDIYDPIKAMHEFLHFYADLDHYNPAKCDQFNDLSLGRCFNLMNEYSNPLGIFLTKSQHYYITNRTSLDTCDNNQYYPQEFMDTSNTRCTISFDCCLEILDSSNFIRLYSENFKHNLSQHDLYKKYDQFKKWHENFKKNLGKCPTQYDLKNVNIDSIKTSLLNRIILFLNDDLGTCAINLEDRLYSSMELPVELKEVRSNSLKRDASRQLLSDIFKRPFNEVGPGDIELFCHNIGLKRPSKIIDTNSAYEKRKFKSIINIIEKSIKTDQIILIDDFTNRKYNKFITNYNSDIQLIKNKIFYCPGYNSKRQVITNKKVNINSSKNSFKIVFDTISFAAIQYTVFGDQNIICKTLISSSSGKTFVLDLGEIDGEFELKVLPNAFKYDVSISGRPQRRDLKLSPISINSSKRYRKLYFKLNNLPFDYLLLLELVINCKLKKKSLIEIKRFYFINN